MTINFRGYVYNDAGAAVSGASVKLLDTGTSTQEGSTDTTDSNGLWSFDAVSEADAPFDVEITKGSSVRRIRWDDQISLKEIDVRNNTGEGTPAATFSNITSNVDDMEVVHFRALRGTGAADDNMFFRYYMNDDGGNVTEVARMTVNLVDAGAATEDAKIVWSVVSGASMVDALTISSSASAAQSIDFNQDSITFGTGTAATDITLTFDAESADGVITWMEDEDYFKFSDDILMNSTEKIQFYDTAIYIYSSTDGQLDLVADTEVQIAATTIDINGAVALNGAITGATDITLSGELDAATLDISGNADIDGTTNLDAVDIDGAVQIDATFTSGVDGQGYDTKFFGDTSGAYILWDTSADKLLTAGGAAVDIVKDKLLIGGTAVTTTAAELNVLDAVTAGTVTASLGVVVDSNKDIGTFRNLTIDGEFTDGNYTFDTSGNVSGLGTVASGAITSSGIIKTDDTTAATSTTDGSLQTDGGLSVALDAVIGDDVFLLSDSAVFNMGAGNDFTITHDGTTGATIAGNPVTITSAGAATWSTSAGALSVTSAAALNLSPAAGSVILLDGTISVDAGVVTGATAITSVTIDATTDFTIGETVITDGVLTDASGFQMAAALDMANNVINNVGDAGNDLGANQWNITNSNAGNNNTMRVDNTDNTSATSHARLILQSGGASGGDPFMIFDVSGGGTVAVGLDNTSSDRYVISNGTVVGTNDRLRLVIGTGVLTVDGDGGTGDDPVGLFDEYDDPHELQRFAYANETAVYRGLVSREQWKANRQRLVDIGVGEWAIQEDGSYRWMMRLQPMARLLAGGIYQSRQRMDTQYEEQVTRMDKLEQRLTAIGG